MMFARFVKCVIKHGMKEEISPLLKEHSAFTDLMMLVPETQTDTFLFISFWNTKADAEAYMEETYPKVTEISKPFLTTMPEVTTYKVESSTFHKIAAGKAA